MSYTKRIAPLKWVLDDEPDAALIAGLIEECDLPGQVVKVLVKRGIDSAETIQRFLRPQMVDLRDPYDMTSMREGIDRVTQAFCNNEKMVIYGDYDVDGITATTLLYMVLSKLGGDVIFYLPNRLVEGYGLSKDGIDQAKDAGVSLIIT
ncbi:MAG: single-stranded-DNA-specific exonuclease RecJ, partial [candidate division Zixibacteria bacterium]|nr:single-stranded-DNA-specific exonuclease RecJ [candidate division Zixibacteria bacterium]